MPRFYVKKTRRWVWVARYHWEILVGPRPPDEWASYDLCSCSPDTWKSPLGKRVAPLWWACLVHDFHYREAVVSRRYADAVFWVNLRLVLRLFGFGGFVEGFVPRLYFNAVRRFGASSYGGSDAGSHASTG